MTTKPYDPADDHDPLFPVDAVPELANGHMGERDTKPVKAVTSALCPKCQAPKALGLIPSGDHLVWRNHDVHTYGGGRLPCRASGVAVCTTGIRAGTTEEQAEKAQCRHQREGRAA